MPLSFFDHLRSERNPWLIGLAVALAAVAVVGLTAWYVLREAPPLFAGGPGAAAPDRAAEDAVSADPEQAIGDPPRTIFVHVAGAVTAPGVYKLAEGQRAVDAIAAAGGPTAEAAVDSINLALPLTDGQRLYVPTRREVEGTPAGGVFSGGKTFAPPGGDGPDGSTGSSGTRAVDLNNATKEQLDGIPGIGPVLAERIILYRTVNGPFKSVDELTKVSGIGTKKLEDLRPYVTVR